MRSKRDKGEYLSEIELEATTFEFLKSYLRSHPKGKEWVATHQKHILTATLERELKSVYLNYPSIRALPSHRINDLIKRKKAALNRGRVALRKKGFKIEDYIVIECVTSDDGLGCWMHTHGMAAFAKPEIEIYGVPVKHVGQISDALNDWCEYMLESPQRGPIAAGHTAEFLDGSFWARFEENIDARTIFHYAGSALEIVELILNGESLLTPERRIAAIAAFRVGIVDGSVKPRQTRGDGDRERVFVPTATDRLKVISNDYSKEEELFRCGLIELVNLNDDAARSRMPPETREIFEKEMSSVSRTFLSEDGGPRVSIVIPFRLANAVFFECLRSVARQFYVQHRPKNVEIIIVQDGEPPSKPEMATSVEVTSQAQFPKAVTLRIFRLRTNQGRSTARNVGIYYSTGDIILFVDSSMVLEPSFLTEQMLRHSRVPGIALLGFKQGISWTEFVDSKEAIYSGDLKPDYRCDLKFSHELKTGEAGFKFRQRRFRVGERIQYMTLTNNFKALDGTTSIGHRTLPIFFQTNIASAPAHDLRAVGGFEAGFDSLWGFEDSHIGALLLASGTKLVPCPSSTAFKIEHGESRTKYFDIKRNRQQFHELLAKRPMSGYTAEMLQEKIDSLLSRGELNEVS